MGISKIPRFQTYITCRLLQS